MLFYFVLLVATLNLAVGYVLGAGRLPSLPIRMPTRRAKPPKDLEEEDVQLTEPVAPPAEAPEPAPEPAKKKGGTAEVMAGLASFREQLSAASLDLKQNEEDPEKFGDCASKLQQVNHDFLEQAQGAIEQLDELRQSGDAEADAAHSAVATGAKECAQISGEIDGLMEGELDEAARKSLLEKSEAICEKAARVDAPAEGTADAEPGVVKLKASANELASLDALFDQLEDLLASSEDDNPFQVAAVRLDPIKNENEGSLAAESIAKSLAGLSAQVLGPDQPLTGGDPAYLLLSGDTFDEASERVERLRQLVEACTFQHGEKRLQATVTCAIAEARAGADRKALKDQLDQALSESERLGENRTFHHDGAFPTPIPELEADVPSQSVVV